MIFYDYELIEKTGLTLLFNIIINQTIDWKWRRILINHDVGEGYNEEDLSKPNEQRGKEESGIVIVGASHAGVGFADHMRKNGFVGSLTLIDRQKGGPMERPPLSKAFLLETVEKVNPMFLLKRGKWYKEGKVALKHGTIVSKIDIESKCLILENDENIKYDKLVLATGAVPRLLPATEGVSNAFVLRQPDDAVAIRTKARKAKSIIIIGGGYIGLEVAATLCQMGLSVSVIEAADRLLARVASPSVARLLAELHRTHGVSVYTGIGVEKIIKESGSFEGVTLSNGTILKGDMLVVGIGVTPNSYLACQAGIETEYSSGGAIVVNEFLQTNNRDVFAIGDVALKRGQSLRIESVHNAQDSAARAAAAIMGKAPPKLQAPWFWSDQYDISLQSVGIVPTDVDDVYQVARNRKHERGKSFWSYQGKQLIAVETIDDADNFMLGKKCLENSISPNPDLVCNPEFDPMA